MSCTPMDFELPRYSASIPAPDYSVMPICGERTLQQTPSSSRSTADSTYIRHSGKTIIVLHNQEANVKIPSYGRGASIAGSVLLESCDNINEVILEINGKIETMSSEEGAMTTVVIDNKRVLWSNVTTQSGRCPCQVEFSVKLPHTFVNNEEERPLPPTYAVDFHGLPGLFVRAGYSMRFLIARKPVRKMGFLTKTKRILIPFDYRPRTRPHHPILRSSCFFSGVKTSPEEWFQTIAPMKTPQNAELGTIYTHLFLPSSRIYGIRDVIPFHVQLNGPEQALRAYLQPTELSRHRRVDRSTERKIPDHPPLFFPILTRKLPSSRPSSASSDFRTLPVINTTTSLPPHLSPPNNSSIHSSQDILVTKSPPSLIRLGDPQQPSLRVFLLRQVTLEARNGKKVWRNQILGEAKLDNVPPVLSTGSFLSPHENSVPHEEDHLDWEGELRINEGYLVGGWQTAGVHVKDFIALSVMPKNERTSTLHGIQLTVPVKLVTDMWTEGVTGLAPVPLETQ